MTSDIRAAYSNRSLFITGGTGFVGKAVIEKLLWTVEDIGDIYLLVREKKELSPEQRFQPFLDDCIFERIRSYKKHMLDKIKFINGDILNENLGISEEDRAMLAEKVSIIIHSAATVRFDEPLHLAMTMNLGGTVKIYELAKTFKQLDVMVHVSTAYANCDMSATEEIVYPVQLEPLKLLELTSWVNEEQFDEVSPILLGKKPNTYTYTKALAESYLVTQTKDTDFPLIIVRPSIIGAMWADPLPGWADNLNGPTAIFTAVGTAALTNMMGSVKAKADIVPVDIVSNTVIIAAIDRINKKPTETPVIHCTSGDLNPLYWETVVFFLEQFFKKFPMSKTYGVPSTNFHMHRFAFNIYNYTKHFSFAQLGDLMYLFNPDKQRFVKAYHRVVKLADTLTFFTTRGWDFKTDNLQKLMNNLSETDRAIYNCDIKQLNWEAYLFDYVMGIKRYVFVEEVDDFSQARWRLNFHRVQRQLTSATIYFLLVNIIGRKWSYKTKWIAWLSGFLTTYSITEINWRRRIPLKSLEQYKKEISPFVYPDRKPMKKKINLP